MDGLVFDRRPIFQWKLLCICCCMYVVLLYQPSHIEFSKHFFFHDDDMVEKMMEFLSCYIYQISTKRLPTLILNVETLHVLSF